MVWLRWGRRRILKCVSGEFIAGSTYTYWRYRSDHTLGALTTAPPVGVPPIKETISAGTGAGLLAPPTSKMPV